MATLLLGAVGSAIGGSLISGTFLGLSGSALGWAAGSLIGNTLFAPSLPDQTGPRLDNLKVTSSAYGAPINIVYGGYRVPGNIIWSSGLEETKHTEEIGGKGGPSYTSTTYTYKASFAVGLCEGELQGIRKIYADSKLIYDMSDIADAETLIASDLAAESITIYLGSETQTADPTIESYEGSGNVPGYRGLAYIVFEDFQLAAYGNRTPNITAEVLNKASNTEELVVVDNYGSAQWPLTTSALFSNTTAARISNNLIETHEIVDNGGTYTGNIYKWLLDGTKTETRSYTLSAPIGGDPFSVKNYPGCYVEWQDGSKVYLNYFNTGAITDNNLYPWLRNTVWMGNSYRDKQHIIHYKGKLVIAGAVYATPRIMALMVSQGGYFGPGYEGAEITGFDMYNFGSDHEIGVDGASLSIGTNTDETELYLLHTHNAYSIATTYGDGRVLLKIGDDFRTIEDYWVVDDLTDDSTGRYDFVINGSKFYCNNKYITLNNDHTSTLVDTDVTWDDQNYHRFIGDRDMVYTAYGVMHLGALVSEGTELLSDIVTDICAKAGLTADDIDVTELTDTVNGYLINNLSSGRGMIEPLRQAFYFDAYESDYKLKFAKR